WTTMRRTSCPTRRSIPPAPIPLPTCTTCSAGVTTSVRACASDQAISVNFRKGRLRPPLFACRGRGRGLRGFLRPPAGPLHNEAQRAFRGGACSFRLPGCGYRCFLAVLGVFAVRGDEK